MKKLWAFMLTLLMCVGMFMIFSPADVQAAQQEGDIAGGVYDNVDWRITAEGELIIGNGTEQTFTYRENRSFRSYPWSNYKTQIKTARFDGKVYGNGSMGYMFSDCSSLTSLDVSNFNTSKVTNMGYMFYNCSSLTSLDVSKFDTSKVTTMCDMFYGCRSLTSLDVSKFDTSKVTTMGSMFYSCSKLTSLDVSNFNTSKVTDMRFMFFGCSKLSSLDVSKFDTSKVVMMDSMFSSCSSLTSLDVSNFNTSKVTNMRYMFDGCSSLTSLDVSGFDTSKVTTMDYMFRNCSSLTSLDVSKFDTSKVTTMSYMFSNCSSLTSLDVSKFDTSKVTTMCDMFYGCRSLTSLDVSNFNTSKVTNMGYMFYNCSSLTSLDVSKFDTSKVTTMSYMFSSCSSLTSFDVSKFDTSKVVMMDSMFSSCSSLTSLDVSKFDTSKVTTMSYMFSNCSSLTSLDVSKFDTSNVTNMGSMFSSCRSLTSLDVSNFNTSKVTIMGSMFCNCSKLTSLDVSGFDTSKVTNMGSMFYNCRSLTSLDVSKFDTSKVTNMSYMFQDCASLTSLDVSKFDTSKVTTMSYMFSSCSSLTSLDVSGFDTSKVTTMESMFYNCSGLKFVKLSPDMTKWTSKAYLPTPSGSAYTGKWIKEDQSAGPLTPAELYAQYPANAESWAGTWVWEERDPNGYVVFDANGGGFTNGAVTKLTFAESEGISPFTTLDEDVTKFPGRFLLGWSENASATSPTYEPGVEINIAQMETTKTLYAVWTAKGTTRYHVEHQQQNYGLDGYTLTEKERLYGEAGSTVTPAVKSYEGFMAPSTQTVTLADDGSTVVTYKYDRLQYKVHFDGNGATSGQLADQKFLIGVGGTLRPNNYSKKGSIFTGWNTAQDGSGTSYTNGANVVDLTTEHGSTVTLYAQWLDNKDHATEPTDGAVRVTLKAGQTVVIPDLPAGTSYTIREVDNPQGWTFDHTDGETGTILANQTNSATVYNVYHAVGSIPLQINKVLVDGLTGESKPIEAGKFTFALIKSDGSQIQLASNEATDNEKVIYDDEGNEVNNPNYGKAIVTFDPIAYDEKDIGKTYTYRIGEVNTPEGYTASDPINVTVSIADAGQGQLDITAQYDNNQTITNTDNSGGKLEIKKLVSGSAPEGAEFTFKVDLTDETGKTYTDMVNGKKSDESNVSITSGETVSLHADESVVFNLPAGIGYTVSEQTQDGWTLVQSSGETGTIVSGETSTATFTNAYNVEGTVTLEADKVLTGKDLTANEFTFVVEDADGNVVATGTNDAEGKVSLVIPYTADDVGNTYEYTVHEVKPEGDTFGITYDETVYGVSIAVSAEGGKIVGNVSITDADKMTFTNTYNAETDITVSGKKVLEGREFRDSDKWTFNLSSEDGPLPENTSVEITPINGDTFSFTIPFSVADMDGAQTKEFTYKVTESGSVLFVANDKSEKTFKVRVTDTKDGILKAELVDADNLDLTFTNKATVTLPATGSTTAIVLTIVGVVVIAGGLFFLLRKKKDDDEDE